MNTCIGSVGNNVMGLLPFRRFAEMYKTLEENDCCKGLEVDLSSRIRFVKNKRLCP